MLKIAMAPDSVQTTDGVFYAANADSVLAGRGYADFYWCPGYSFFLLLCKCLAGDTGYQYMAVALQYAILVACALLTTRCLLPHRLTGAVTAIAIVLAPQLLNAVARLRNDILCMGLVTPAVCALICRPLTRSSIIQSALLTAAAIHVRNTSLAILVAVGLWLLLSPRAGLSLRERARLAFMYTTITVLALLPWSMYASSQTHTAVLIATNMKKAISLGLWVGEHNQALVQDRSNLDNLPPPTPAEYLKTKLASLATLWSPLPVPATAYKGKWLIQTATMWLTTPGFLLLLWRAIRTRAVAPPLTLALSVVGIYTISLSMVYVRLKYRFCIEPLLFATAAAGWSGLLNAARRN